MPVRPTSDPTFCTGGTRVAPGSGLRTSGYAPNDGLGAEHLNGLWGVQGDWIEHLTESISAEYDFGPESGWISTLGGSGAAVLTPPDAFAPADGYWSPSTNSVNANLLLPFPRDFYEGNTLVKTFNALDVWGRFGATGDTLSYVLWQRVIATGVLTQIKAAKTISGATKGTGAIFTDSDNYSLHQLQAGRTYGIGIQLQGNPANAVLFIGARVTMGRSRTQ